MVSYAGTGLSTPAWSIRDERGSVIALTDASGLRTQLNTYDPFGRPGAGNAGRFGYTGQMNLPGPVPLQHYRTRAYSPDLNRFLQPDTIGYAGGMNLYAYVGGDPVNRVDPWGTAECGDRLRSGRVVGSVYPCPTTYAEELNLFGIAGFGSDIAGSEIVRLAFATAAADPAEAAPAPRLCDRRFWHDLQVDFEVALLRAHGFVVATNVQVRVYGGGQFTSYAVADYLVDRGPNAPDGIRYEIGEIKTGDANLTRAQRIFYNSGFVQIRGNGAR